MILEKEIAGRHASIWNYQSEMTDYPTLDKEITVDIVVVGGGIAGVTTALLLNRLGAEVALVEAGRIGRKVTGHSTAKVTSAHGLIYKYLIDVFGEKKAKIYAKANQHAIDKIADVIKENNIECDFQRTKAFTYTQDKDNIHVIKEEVHAAKTLGLPVSYVENPDLPAPAAAAIQYDYQAYFNPVKYILGCVKEITSHGSHVFENSRVTDIHDTLETSIETEDGKIKAKTIIQACHFPFYDPLLLFGRMEPKRSYIIGCRIEPGSVPEGMYYSGDDNYFSFRTHVHKGETFLLVGGEKHTVAHGEDTNQHYINLEKTAGEKFNIKEIVYRWSNQDNYTVDRVPFIGNSSLTGGNVYVATGFSGWGMTQGVIAGMILSDQVLDRDNPWEDLYSPSRVGPMEAKGDLVKRNLHVAKDLFHGLFRTPREKEFQTLNYNEGKLLEIDGQKVAAYRDVSGFVHAVSPYCTHMGCECRWNNGEKSWDCPCHGSRFNIDGEVLHGPTVEKLPAVPHATLEVNKMSISSKGIPEMDTNTGKLVKIDGKLVAVYRDPKGNYSAYSPVCNHCSCIVNWNNESKTWECSCHKTRYDATGHLAKGPGETDMMEIMILD